ncbi:MAG: DciA family protein [Cycloclasticus sp.]
MFKQPFKNNPLSKSGLQQVQKTLSKQGKLLGIVKSSLPKDLASHCLHVITNQGRVTVFTDSSVWASKLLYLRKVILDELSSHFGTLQKSLKVKVLSKQVIKAKSRPKSPSNTALSFLAQANDADATDPLGVSMNKLITALQKKRQT